MQKLDNNTRLSSADIGCCIHYNIFAQMFLQNSIGFHITIAWWMLCLRIEASLNTRCQSDCTKVVQKFKLVFTSWSLNFVAAFPDLQLQKLDTKPLKCFKYSRVNFVHQMRLCGNNPVQVCWHLRIVTAWDTLSPLGSMQLTIYKWNCVVFASFGCLYKSPPKPIRIDLARNCARSKNQHTGYVIMFMQDPQWQTFKAVSIIGEYNLQRDSPQQQQKKSGYKIKSIIKLASLNTMCEFWRRYGRLNGKYVWHLRQWLNASQWLLFWFNARINCPNETCLFSVNGTECKWQWHFIFFGK